MNTKDLRVIKTKNNIRSAFIDLLSEKDFHSITVQNILDKAMINRSTFYAHYLDKYDLLEQIANDFINTFREDTKKRNHKSTTLDYYYKTGDEIYNLYFSQRKLILALWDVHTDNVNFYQSLKDILMQRFKEVKPSPSVDLAIDLDYQAELFATINLSTLRYVMMTGKILTSRSIADAILDLAAFVISPP